MLLLPARHTAANPPHAAAAADSWDRRMDGQMDGRRTITQTLQHTMRAVSKTADVLHRMYLRKCPMPCTKKDLAGKPRQSAHTHWRASNS